MICGGTISGNRRPERSLKGVAFRSAVGGSSSRRTRTSNLAVNSFPAWSPYRGAENIRFYLVVRSPVAGGRKVSGCHSPWLDGPGQGLLFGLIRGVILRTTWQVIRPQEAGSGRIISTYKV